MPNSPYIKNRRLRVFGGPNGSGKTTIIELIKSSFDVGFYINADDIEKEVSLSGKFDLSSYNLDSIDPKLFDSFIQNHGMTKKAGSMGYKLDMRLNEENILVDNSTEVSYEAALIAEFLRQELLNKGKKMTFETVMSHPSKIDLIKRANQNGYKTYLYFICTSSPKINIERVNLRVKKGGHHVEKELIEKRYYNSLELLKETVSNTYRSFIWDNSGKEPKLILEVYNGKEVIAKTNQIPYWIHQYLLS